MLDQAAGLECKRDVLGTSVSISCPLPQNPSDKVFCCPKYYTDSQCCSMEDLEAGHWRPRLGWLRGLHGPGWRGPRQGHEVHRHYLRGGDPPGRDGADLLLLPPLLPPQQAPPEGPDTRSSYRSRGSTHGGTLPNTSSQHRIPTAAARIPSDATPTARVPFAAAWVPFPTARVPFPTARVPFAAARVSPYAAFFPRQPPAVPWAAARTGGSGTLPNQTAGLQP